MPLAAIDRACQHSVPAPGLEVRTVTSYDAFLNLEAVWNDLVHRAGVEYPFLEHAWVRTWWECFGENSRLNILVLLEGERAVAIAPMMLTTIRMWGIKARQLGFLYNAHVPRADFIIDERIIAEGIDGVYEAIWKHLSGNRKWDFIQFCQLTASSPTLGRLRALAASTRLPSGIWRSGKSPYVPLDSGWNAYYEKLANKHRSNLRNRFNRLGKTGPVELETVAGGERRGQALNEGLQLEAAAWKGDAGTAIYSDPRVTRFYTLLSERAAERGWLRLNFLRAGSKAVAFDYSLEYRNRMFLLKLGYDPAFSAYSPSNLLLAETLRSAFEHGLVEYDFLGEEADWKRCWASDSRPNHWLYIFSASFKGRFLYFVKFDLVPWIRRSRACQWIVALAERTGMRTGR